MNIFKAIKKTLVDSSPLPKNLIVYSNIRIRFVDFQSKLLSYLDADDDINQHEVIVMYGKFPKAEKSRYTQFFLNPEHPDDDNINMLCATSGVGNVGLDLPHIINVFRMVFLPSPLYFVQ